MCTPCTYTNIQMQTHGYTHRKAHPYSQIGKRLNIESMWSQACCGETRSKNSYSTVHICMHAHKRLHTTRSIIDFLFKTSRNNQHTIYYSANTYLNKQTEDKKVTQSTRKEQSSEATYPNRLRFCI